jgi:2-dehydropantoate 2-reductase
MEEVVATAHAEGAKIDPCLVQQNIDKTLTMGAYRSSMQIDQEMGRPIELDAIIGQPLAAAKRHGIPTPAMLMLYQLLCIVTKSAA